MNKELVRRRDAKLVELGPEPPWWRLFARRRWHRRFNAIMAIDCSELTAMMLKIYESYYKPENVRVMPRPTLMHLKKSDGSYKSISLGDE